MSGMMIGCFVLAYIMDCLVDVMFGHPIMWAGNILYALVAPVTYYAIARMYR